jgi:putative NADH-flavin reductase
MKILIIGATRGIGKALCEEALADGHQVRVLARDPAKMTMQHDNLEVVQGDVRNDQSVREAARGQEVVCSCIGVPITFSPVDLFSVAAATLIGVVQESVGQKLIVVTGIGAGDSKGHGGFLYDKLFKPLFLKTIYEDKDREEELIMASGLDWLIVRPAGLTNGPRSGTYRVYTDLAGVTSKRISRRDVADFILKEMVEPAHFGNAVLLTY